MRISRELIDELIAHAREEAPNECCGVVAVEAGHSSHVAHTGHKRGLAGADETATLRAARLHRAVNAAASPLRFEVDGRELLDMIEAIEQDGYELGAIYHSHTRTAPYPSQTDVNFAGNWPGVEWIIVGLAGEEPPQVRSYLISDGEVQEVAIEETPG